MSGKRGRFFCVSSRSTRVLEIPWGTRFFFSSIRVFSLVVFSPMSGVFSCQSQICVSCQMVRGAHLTVIFSLHNVILSDCCLGGDGEVVGQVRA